jgi:hypothetical protein
VRIEHTFARMGAENVAHHLRKECRGGFEIGHVLQVWRSKKQSASKTVSAATMTLFFSGYANQRVLVHKYQLQDALQVSKPTRPKPGLYFSESWSLQEYCCSAHKRLGFQLWEAIRSAG